MENSDRSPPPRPSIDPSDPAMRARLRSLPHLRLHVPVRLRRRCRCCRTSRRHRRCEASPAPPSQSENRVCRGHSRNTTVNVDGRDSDASLPSSAGKPNVTPTRSDCSAINDGSLEPGLIRNSPVKSNSPSTRPGFGRPRQSVISCASTRPSNAARITPSADVTENRAGRSNIRPVTDSASISFG